MSKPEIITPSKTDANLHLKQIKQQKKTQTKQTFAQKNSKKAF
jgi:hypothetical protein